MSNSNLTMGHALFNSYYIAQINPIYNQFKNPPKCAVCKKKSETPKEDTTPLLGSCKITYSGEPSLRIGGSTKTFIATFKDRYGKEITGITPSWELDFFEYPELSGRVHIIKELGNEITIKAVGNSTLIDKYFVLKFFADSDYGYFECRTEITLNTLF